jgi:hypothetical protein
MLTKENVHRPNSFAVKTLSLDDVWHEPVHNCVTGSVSIPVPNTRTKASLEVEQALPAKKKRKERQKKKKSQSNERRPQHQGKVEEKGKVCSSIHQLHPLTLTIPNLDQRRCKRHTLSKPPLRTRLQVPPQIRLRPNQRPRSRGLAHTNTSSNAHCCRLRTAVNNFRFPLAVRASNNGLFGSRSLEGFGG